MIIIDHCLLVKVNRLQITTKAILRFHWDKIMEVIDTHMHLWTPETHPWVLDFKDGGHPAGKWGKIAKTPSLGVN